MTQKRTFACPVGGTRGLTDGEKALVGSVFGAALQTETVLVKRRKWFPFQPTNTLMAPTGHVHFPAKTRLYRDDFAQASLTLQALFLHEMTHVWQSQIRGKYWLVMMRHPFCRYDYAIKPGQKLEKYGIEQQAEIVRHAFLLRHGHPLIGAPPREQLESILPFRPVT